MSSFPQPTVPAATLEEVFLGCKFWVCPAHLLHKMEGMLDDGSKVRPRVTHIQHDGNLHSGLYLFVWDAAGPVASSNFVEMGRMAKAGDFCAEAVPYAFFNHR